MKLKQLHLNLLFFMLLTGLIYGLVYHYLVMPLIGNELIHCLITGMIFGFINYSISIEIYKRFYELKKVNNNLMRSVNVDKLTDLLNRRAFDKDMLQISESDTYSLIFIDIDNFRRFNNEFGHKAGDTVLKNVSKTIKNTIRSNDRAYRYGGEEIVIFLKDCNKINALTIAENLRKNISEFDNSPLPSITVSLGVASCPEDGSNSSKIIIASDSALLNAKKSGKNCTFLYNDKHDTIGSNC